MVFKGVVGGMERWDNNGGSNWSLAVEVAPGEGLVAALNPSYASTRALVGVPVHARLEPSAYQRSKTVPLTAHVGTASVSHAKRHLP